MTPSASPPAPAVAPHARLPYPYRNEAACVEAALDLLKGRLDWPRVIETARPWVQAVRDKPAPFWAMESLLRVPDTETAIALTADQLGRAEFEGASDGTPYKLLSNLSASAIALSKRFLPESENPPGVLQRLGSRTVVGATVRAIQLLGRQFVLGRNIDEAMAEAASQRRSQAALRFSYDMLGEGARTDDDARRYLASYANAIHAIAEGPTSGPESTPMVSDGISIKLSALHARYEDLQRQRVFSELLPRVRQLVDQAAAADINLTIDAEESDRLEISLDLFEALAQHIRQHHPRWQGFGLAVQAYQTRSLQVIDEVARIARSLGLRFMVRLVKGAYWDGEIKRAQEGGLAGYPVYTHKHHTDISYLACAARLIEHHELIYPQFATHNAGTIAAILQMAQTAGADFEMQRLHGMGDGIYRELLSRQIPASELLSVPSYSAAHPARAGSLTRSRGAGAGVVPLRIYAPVGEHRDLLAYLVRRLLENGANSSFVHQLADEMVAADLLLASPLLPAAVPALPLPVALYGATRANSKGADLACIAERDALVQAVQRTALDPEPMATTDDAVAAMAKLQAGFDGWVRRPLAERSAVLRRAADALEARLPEFCGLLVKEAQKTLGDCIAEVREAVDFCRYYAMQADRNLADQVLPGPTGESNVLRLHGRGVFICISPWNFPLAIFAGQVVAALVAGNTVAAKPAEQTPRVARRFVELLHEVGVPSDALQCIHGPGETVGATLVADVRTAGVCFTGSTPVARAINRTLAAKDGPIVPLIAETGGLNAMVVDSSALPEQVIDAVVHSAFRSAGQRCSALRLLCVHESVADGVIEMLRGALAELQIGDPADLATDVGPVIDDEAFSNIGAHVARLRKEAKLLGEKPVDAATAQAVPNLIGPVAFEIDRIADLQVEIFGPVLQVVRWGPQQKGAARAHGVAEVVQQINALGYGLTLGVQTRIDSRAHRIADAARIGNVYVNRNMTGAVVGVQPFGGEGLSGTGPKAGGPHYLFRFCNEQTLTINTAAAGGNVELLTGLHSL